MLWKIQGTFLNSNISDWKFFLNEYFGNISARGKKLVWYARWRGSKKGSIFVWLTVNPEFSGKWYDWPWNYFSLRWIEYKIWKNEGVMLRIQNCSSLQLEKLYEVMLNPCSRIFENHESFLPSPIRYVKEICKIITLMLMTKCW